MGSRAPARLRDELPTIAALVVVVGLLALSFSRAYRIGWAGFTFFEIAHDILAGTWFSDVRYQGATYFSPGYGLLLAAASKVTGASLLTSAKLFTAVGWIASVLGVRVLYRDLGGRRGWWEWIALGFVAVSPQITTLHLLALPEPIYLATCTWTLVVVERFSRRPTLALAVGLVLLTTSAVWLRYAGVGLVGAAGLRLLLERDWPWKRRIGGAALAGIGLLALCGWLFVQIDAGHGHAPTEVKDQSFEVTDITNSIASFGSHVTLGIEFSQDEDLINATLDPFVRVACTVSGAAMIALLSYAAWRGRARDEPNALAGVVEGLRSRGLLTIALYAVGTIGFMSVWRFQTGYMILPRYWTPVVIPLFTAVFAMTSRHQPATGWVRPVTRVASALLLVALAAMSLYLFRNPRGDDPRLRAQLEMTRPAVVLQPPGN